MKKARITYWGLLLLTVIVALVLELTDIADGIFPQQTMTEVMSQYISIMATMVLIYLALKLIRKSPVLRILMLIIPMVANTVMYHIFSLTPSFGYLAIMCLLAYPFVFPSKTAEE